MNQTETIPKVVLPNCACFREGGDTMKARLETMQVGAFTVQQAFSQATDEWIICKEGLAYFASLVLLGIAQDVVIQRSGKRTPIFKKGKNLVNDITAHVLGIQDVLDEVIENARPLLTELTAEIVKAAKEDNL